MMATKAEGTAKQNGTPRQLRAASTPVTGATIRGKSKRTMKYEQSVRDNKTANGKDY
jgi:hypothetical protein